MYCPILLFSGSMGRSHFKDHKKNFTFSKFSKIDQVMVSQFESWLGAPEVVNHFLK
jgi:hypothetical protein